LWCSVNTGKCACMRVSVYVSFPSHTLIHMFCYHFHRYYGESLPYGSTNSFKLPQLKALTVDNAMKDFIATIAWAKKHYMEDSGAHAKVVAFGGSYGGMLSAWFRMDYPEV
jgi:hypothetical protein